MSAANLRAALPWLAFVAGVASFGCAELPPILSTADAVGRGVAHVFGWCRDNHADPALLAQALESARAGDYAAGLEVLAKAIEALKAAGVTPPPETATILDLAREAAAARAIEQGMRALSAPKAP